MEKGLLPPLNVFGKIIETSDGTSPQDDIGKQLEENGSSDDFGGDFLLDFNSLRRLRHDVAPTGMMLGFAETDGHT